MQRLLSTVLDNKAIADGYFRLTFSLPKTNHKPNPGQFLTLRIGEGISPLLRRPFAYASLDSSGREASIIYERRGSATHLLSAFLPGDDLDVLGPLGNEFPHPGIGRTPILVAGGIGIGPLLFLHQLFLEKGLNPILITGARTASKIASGDLPDQSIICTDDGSMGFKGTVLQALQGLNSENMKMELFACGPHGMMKAVATWCAQFGLEKNEEVPCWISMEQTMACAVGACMGCVVKVHHEKQFSRVCTEGPIFAASVLDWT